MKTIYLIASIILIMTILILGFENINNLGTFYFLTSTNNALQSMMGPVFLVSIIGMITGSVITLYFTTSDKHRQIDDPSSAHIEMSSSFGNGEDNEWK